MRRRVPNDAGARPSTCSTPITAPEIHGIDAEPPSEIVVDGFAGKYVEYTTPATGCAAFGAWQTPSGLVLSPSTDARYWVLDVDGTRLVMLAYLWDVATQQGRAELQAIIDSVEITP